MKVNLNDVIECIEFENENLNHFYNKNTGVIIYKESPETSNYSAADYSRINEFEDWERELIESLYDLENNPNDYIKLPGEDEINELNDILNYLKRNDRIEIEYYDGYDYRLAEDVFQNYDVIRREIRCRNRKYRLYDLKMIRFIE